MKKLLLLASLAVATTTNSYAQAPSNSLPYRLAAYYPFSGNAQDAVGTTHGQVVGGVQSASDRNWNAGDSFSFDGYSGYIDLGNSLDTVFTGSDAQFAITAWVKLNSTDSEWTYNRLFVNKSGDSGCGENEQEFYFRYYQGQLNFSFGGRGHSFARYVNSDFTIADTLWHHVAVTYDATAAGNDGLNRVKLYADGQPRTTRILPNSFGPLDHMTAGTAHLGIGNRLGSTGQPCPTVDVPGFFQGSLDDIAIYNRVITPLEVNLLATPLRNGPLAAAALLKNSPVTVFPTHTSDGLVNVAAPARMHPAYNVLNSLGQVVAQGVLTGSQLDLRSQPVGVYLVRFFTPSQVVAQRIVLE